MRKNVVNEANKRHFYFLRLCKMWLMEHNSDVYEQLIALSYKKFPSTRPRTKFDYSVVSEVK